VVRFPRLWLTLLYLLLCIAFYRVGVGAGWVAQAVLGWMGVACLLVALAYLLDWPGIFGKRRDGTVAYLVALPVLPVLLVMRLFWWLRAVLTSENAVDRVAPRLFVGRRLAGSDALPDEVDFVIDLTCELAEHDDVLARGVYCAIRTLDGCAPPSHDDRDDVLREAAAHPGSVYVHCAFGHGRAVAAAAAIMVLRGDAVNADDAFAMIRAARPGIFPSGSHHRFVSGLVR